MYVYVNEILFVNIVIKKNLAQLLLDCVTWLTFSPEVEISHEAELMSWKLMDQIVKLKRWIKPKLNLLEKTVRCQCYVIFPLI